MASLYNIADNILQLLAMMEEDDCIVSAECIEDTFEGLEGELSDKVNSWCRAIQSFKNEADAIDAERDRLLKRKKTLENAEIRMKAALYRVLTALGYGKGNSFKTPLYTINRFTNKKYICERDSLIPEDWKVEKVSTKLTADNSKIKAALDKGEKLPFAKYVESLSIK